MARDHLEYLHNYTIVILKCRHFAELKIIKCFKLFILGDPDSQH
jgi:hypothetical protein